MLSHQPHVDKQCDICDMRYRISPELKLEFVGLSEERFELFRQGNASDAAYLGKVWIGKTGEWNVDYEFPPTMPEMRNLPINECLKILGYNQKAAK